MTYLLIGYKTTLRIMMKLYYLVRLLLIINYKLSFSITTGQKAVSISNPFPHLYFDWLLFTLSIWKRKPLIFCREAPTNYKPYVGHILHKQSDVWKFHNPVCTYPAPYAAPSGVSARGEARSDFTADWFQSRGRQINGWLSANCC